MMDWTVESIRQALAGDKAAVDALIGMAIPLIQARVARAMLRSGSGARGDRRQEVEDFTQQIFVALLSNDARALLQWDPARGASLPNFIGMVAEREVYSILRSRRRSPFTHEPMPPAELEAAGGDIPGPEAQLASREFQAVLLGRLRARQSPLGLALFQWLLVDGLDIDEVCRLADMTTAAVYAWRSRLLRQVRELSVEILSEGDSAPRNPQAKAKP